MFTAEENADQIKNHSYKMHFLPLSLVQTKIKHLFLVFINNFGPT